MIEYFANDKYKILQCMLECQISVNDEKIIKLSQQEIADILKLSKVKINTLIAELKNDGYIIQKSIRGGYYLTKKANDILQQINDKEAIK